MKKASTEESELLYCTTLVSKYNIVPCSGIHENPASNDKTRDRATRSLSMQPSPNQVLPTCEDSNDAEDSIIPHLRKLGSLSNSITIIQVLFYVPVFHLKNLKTFIYSLIKLLS